MNLLTHIIPEVESYVLYHRLVQLIVIKSVRYNGHVIWNDFFQNTDNSNLCNTGISKFKHYLKDLLISKYNID